MFIIKICNNFICNLANMNTTALTKHREKLTHETSTFESNSKYSDNFNDHR